MIRRTFLGQVVIVGSVASIGGCLGERGSEGTQQDTSTTSEPSDCPSFVPNSDTTTCTDGPRVGESAIYLEPESHTFTVITDNRTVETFGLHLHNQSDNPFLVDPGAWFVMHRMGNGWTESATGDDTGAPITIAPGRTHTWSLSLVPHPSPRTDETTFITADLEQGKNVFGVVGETKREDGGGRRVECLAEFELVK